MSATATGFDNVEFTDRYGDRRPNWLTACHDCDAMGCYPRKVSDTGDFDADYDFVVCESCKGTALGPWYLPIVRLPKWLWRGAGFVITVTRRKEMHWPGTTFWQRLKLGVQCAWLADLGLWKP